MASPAYQAELEAASRIPVDLVKLTVTGTIAGSSVFRFSNNQGPVLSRLLGVDVFPLLLRSAGRPARIQPDQGITERENISLQFRDDEDFPDYDPAVFTVFSGGSFFKRLVVSQPDYRGSRIEVFRGFFTPGFTEVDFEQTFKGRVEDIDFNADQSVIIKAKDLFTFNDREIPGEVSDANVLDGAIGKTTTAIDVLDGDELTDPDTLPSKDFFPVVFQLNGTENFIAKSIVGDTINVQENQLDRSEAFDNGAWTKGGTASVTPNQNVGPFGGDLIADTLNLPAAGDAVEQSVGIANANLDFVFSVWLRALIPGTIDLEIEDPGVPESTTLSVIVTNLWQRFEVVHSFSAGGTGTVESRIIRTLVGDIGTVQAFGAQLEQASARGFYVGTTNTGGDDAGRGAFGTATANHANGSPFREVVIYRNHLDEGGAHPVVIVRDLVNRIEIAPSDVNQESFDSAFEFIETSQFRRGLSGSLPDSTILSPKNALIHSREVRQQSLIDLWLSEEGLVNIRLSFRPPSPGQAVAGISDEQNVVFRSSSVKGNGESRATRIVIHYNRILGLDGDRPSHFSNHQITVDLAVEAVPGAKFKPLFSLWIFRASEAVGSAGRILQRFKRGARIGTWDLELKDDLQVRTGELILVDSNDILRQGGTAAVRGTTTWTVTQKSSLPRRANIKVRALELPARRVAFISPAATPVGTFPDDYDLATAAERIYGFWGTAVANLVGTAQEDGYFIL